MGTKELILMGVAMLLALSGITVGFDVYNDKKFMAKVTSTVSAVQQSENWATTWSQMNTPRFDNTNINMSTMKTDLEDMTQVAINGTGAGSTWVMPFDERFTLALTASADGKNRIYTINASGSEWTAVQKGKFEQIMEQKIRTMGGTVGGVNNDGIVTATF